nr:unnamed protein product [Digitaria exilis]
MCVINRECTDELRFICIIKKESDGISQKDVESLDRMSLSDTSATPGLSTAGGSKGKNTWKPKSIVTLALTLLTSSQAILIVWSKRAGKYEYSVTTAIFRLTTSFDEIRVYPIPAILYLVKNLLQICPLDYMSKLCRLSEIQWAAFILLCAGCTTAQLNPLSDHVLQTPIQGWMMAIVMALLSGFAGVYTEAIIKKRPSRNIYVQNFWLYIFGMLFNLVAIFLQDFGAVINKGFFHGYSFITVLMILNHALSGIAVSMVMKYADNIVKVYSTSVAMLLTAIVSVFLFSFHISLAFFLGSTVVSVSVYLHSVGKLQQQK